MAALARPAPQSVSFLVAQQTQQHAQQALEASLHRRSSAGLEASTAGTAPPRLNPVRCMANPRRVKMVAQQIRREVSSMLLFDKVIRDTMTPEHALGADRYLSSVASISEVEVSGDLQVAKVYVSVYGDERGQELAMAGLKSLSGYIRQGLGKKMRLRFTPEVRFIQDEAIERGSRVLSILSQLKKERVARENGEVVPRSPMIAEQYEDDDDMYDDFGEFGSLTEPQEAQEQRPAESPSAQSAQPQANGEQDDDDSSSGKGGNIYLV